jgi:hypothetical protein
MKIGRPPILKFNISNLKGILNQEHILFKISMIMQINLGNIDDWIDSFGSLNSDLSYLR